MVFNGINESVGLGWSLVLLWFGRTFIKHDSTRQPKSIPVTNIAFQIIVKRKLLEECEIK